MLWGTVLSIPIIAVSLVWGRILGKRIWQIPSNNDGWTRDKAEQLKAADTQEDMQSNLPTWLCFAPILSAILFIILKTALASFGVSTPVTDLLGQPIFALALGLLLAIYGLTKTLSTKETLGAVEQGLASSGKLMLLVGGGGALGSIIQTSGLGDYIAAGIMSTPIPPLLLPFLIALLLRVAQGSGAVSMTTAASVVAPMIATLGLNPVMAALAACIGAIPFSHFNDSYFWVINETIGIEQTKEQMQVWSVTTTIAGFLALICLLVINQLVG